MTCAWSDVEDPLQPSAYLFCFFVSHVHDTVDALNARGRVNLGSSTT